MICTLTARRLKPGSQDEFRAAFERAGKAGPEEIMKRWKRVFVCADVTDPDVMLTFGFFDGTLEELREIQAGMPAEDRAATLDTAVEGILLDGSYEVIEEITP